MKWYLSLIFSISILTIIFAQEPKDYSSGDIHEAIKRLNVLASVLYVAAHPDDENTRLISYFSNEKKAHTTYLSLTRGDGGQNLIGTEIKELLGVIRTQELMAARRIDGGNQFFTRAIDFGYSKHSDETLKIWDKEEVLADVVWAIRKFQPDVIINRFDHTTPGRTHGHHTSSAILSVEAFDLSGDEKVFPGQLAYADTWQSRRLFHNISWWSFGSREAFDQADKSNMVAEDVGVYFPLQGRSNGEIAASSRSMHKSQGFGATSSRGRSMEYLDLIKGDLPADRTDIFDGIDITWGRIAGGKPIGSLVFEIENEFDHEHPEKSIPKLMEAYQMISRIGDQHWRDIKLKEIKTVIYACLGLHLEAICENFYASPGDRIHTQLEATNQSSLPVLLKRIKFQNADYDSLVNLPLGPNQENTIGLSTKLEESLAYSNPYWLNHTGTLGLYHVEEQKLRGDPETLNPLKVFFHCVINGDEITFERDVVYKTTDPVKGEFYRPFEVIPKITTTIRDEVYIFANKEPQKIEVELKAYSDSMNGILSLDLTDGWTSSPDFIPFEIAERGMIEAFVFEVTPPDYQSESKVSAHILLDGNTYHQSITEIQYDHIPVQTILQNAESRIVRIDIETLGNRIAYIPGAGDKIPECLTQIGYQVEMINASDISKEALRDYDACILGIRAYDVNPELKFKQNDLLDYVSEGGTLIVQYNTTRDLDVENLGPYSLEISRDRVAEEDAEVRFLDPGHPVLNYPNQISGEDFQGWVQERGLYFPGEWDSRYQAILSMNDTGETPKDGSLLVTQFGKGHYIYSGISWFRQLPAGVPGAYRLFANLISIGTEKRP